ncbi:MAG: O-antigen ligase family protein [Candidatus Omnitrophota bacterium]
MHWTERLDQWIRFLMYVLIFWMPYSQAVIEVCVGLAFLLWIVKRVVLFCLTDKTKMSVVEHGIYFIKSFRPPRNGLTLPIFIFLGFCLASAILSEYSSKAIHGLISKTCEWFVIFFLVCESFKNRKHVHIALTTLTITIIALALDSIQQYYITHRDIFMGRMIKPGARATGSFEAPSSLGAIYTILLPLFALQLFDRAKMPKVRGFILGAIFIFIWSLVLSFSRGAILGIGLSGLFIVFTVLYHLKQEKVKAYVILYLAGLMIVVMSKISLGDYPQFGFLNRRTSDFRIVVWEDTFKMIKDRPLLGHGPNTYMRVFNEKYRRKALGKYRHLMTYSNHSPTFAHNCFLQIWAETGIFSLGAFFWILFRLFKDSIRQIKIFFVDKDDGLFLAFGLLSGLVAFLTQSFFDTNFYSLQLSSYFWYMAGLLMVINGFSIQKERGGQYA